MIEHVHTIGPPDRIVGEQLVQQVAGIIIVGVSAQKTPNIACILARQVNIFVQSQMDGLRPIDGRNGSAHFENVQYLPFLGVALEEGLSLPEFRQNATGTPHVNGFIVFVGAQEQFWGSIPQCHDWCGQTGGGRLARLHFIACQTEIADLQDAGGIDQDVLGFHVTMQDLKKWQRTEGGKGRLGLWVSAIENELNDIEIESIDMQTPIYLRTMNVLQTNDQLMHNPFDLLHPERHLLVADNFTQIIVAILENQLQIRWTIFALKSLKIQ